MSEEQNKELVMKALDLAFNQRNAEAAGELYSENFVGIGPGFTQKGRAGAVAGLQTFIDAFTETAVQFEHLIAEGDRVVAHFSGTCVHTREFQGNVPTGRPVAVNGVMIARVQDGLIAQLWFTLHWEPITTRSLLWGS